MGVVGVEALYELCGQCLNRVSRSLTSRHMQGFPDPAWPKPDRSGFSMGSLISVEGAVPYNVLWLFDK